jgi:hypothetical protein
MTMNTGRGFRQGEVKERSQVLKPATKQWVKRDAETGQFMDLKEDGESFKGVRREN